MKSLTTIARTVAVAVAAGVVLAGCSSATDTKATDTSTTSTEQSTTTQASGPTNIREYIDSNGIKETVIRRGEPGPEIDLPVPAGWEIKNDVKAAPYGAIVYTKPAIPTNPPRILAILSKLTGDVDPKKILQLAPGELQQTPGWDGPEKGTKSKLGGYDAVQIGGRGIGRLADDCAGRGVSHRETGGCGDLLAADGQVEHGVSSLPVL